MQKDYIMRAIEHFVQLLASIISKKNAGKFEEALEQIQTASRFYLKTDLSLLLYRSPDQLLDHFRRYSGELDTEQCVLCADLFYELAEIRDAQKNSEEALRLKILSLYLYTKAIPQEQQFQDSVRLAKISTLIEELKEKSLPESTRSSLLLYQDFLKNV